MTSAAAGLKPCGESRYRDLAERASVTVGSRSSVDRIALLGRQLQAAKCPPVVALEEISERMYGRIAAAPWVGECKYKVVWHDMPSTDRELVLTTLPVTNQKLTILAGNFRSAYRVDLRSKLGPLVLVVSHQDGDPEPGDPKPRNPAECPPECPPEITLSDCQTNQAKAIAAEGGGSKTLRVLTGDFNVTAASQRYRSIVADDSPTQRPSTSLRSTARKIALLSG